MRNRCSPVVLAIVATLACGSARALVQVRVTDGWFVVNGERFFVKGIGYELGGGRGGIPWERTFDPETMEHDLRLMKEAGFNTVRSWNPYTVEELELLRKHGMMVIQGSWFSFDRYLRDEAYARKSREKLAQVVRTAKRFDHILFHTITNEPHAHAIIDAGMAAYDQACGELRETARREDPDCLVTYSHCSRNEFLDQSVWDVVFFNDYMYAPHTIPVALKYRGHVEWLRKMHAQDKPFVLGEFGLSISKSGEGNMGYGGNTPEEQRDGDLLMYQAMIDAGGQGGCLFMWRDGWWKRGDKMTHDDHAEEWYGVLGIDDWDSDPRGTPRPVYHAFKEYNQLILTEPRQMVVYRNRIPVDAYVTDRVKDVRYRIDDGPWTGLEQVSRSWRHADSADLADGRHTVEVWATLSIEDIGEIRRTVDVIVGDPGRALPKFSVSTDKAVYEYGEEVVVHVRATAGGGAPLPELPLVGTYEDHGNRHGRRFGGKTDANGTFERRFPLFVKPTFITLAAGADAGKHGVRRRLSDAAIIEVRGLRTADVEEAAHSPGRLLAGFEYAVRADFDRALGRVLGGAAEFAVTLGTESVKQGSAALSLRLQPESGNSWGFTEIRLDSPVDVSGDRAISYWLHGDSSGHNAKVMLIDADGERWLDDPVVVDFRGWRRIVFCPRTPQRDAHDGVTDGDSRPNPDRVAGFAFAVIASNETPSTVIIDAITAHK